MSLVAINNDEGFDLGMERIVSVVPWYNAAQFQKVYEYLYSDDLAKKKWAYDTITIWETRCNSSLPTAIEASYVLTTAVIQDILFTNHSSFIHHTDLQSIYGSAITRFTSLTVEVHQDKSCPWKRSATDIAKGLGIPSFVLELRNEFCHSLRPSLSRLRIATATAFKYLKDSFWDIEAARVKNHVKEPRDETDLKCLLRKYMCLKFRIIMEEDKSTAKENLCHLKEEFSSYKKQIMRSIKNDKRHFIKVLTLDGCFIPLEEELRCMATDEELLQLQPNFDEDEKDDDDEEDDDEDDEDEDEDDDDNESVFLQRNKKFKCGIPVTHEKLWAPVIKLLNMNDAVPIFMESLLRSQRERTVPGQKLIVAYVLKILRIHAVSGHVEPSPLSRIFKNKGIVVNWPCMFYAAIANPCKYTTYVLPLLFVRLNLKKDVTLRILNLLAIQLGCIKDKTFQKQSKVFTVEELRQIKERQNAEREKKSGKSVDCIGSFCPDNHNKLWAIGSIINAISEETEEEEIEESSIDNFIEKTEFSERFLPNNENDEHCVMDVDKSDVILPDFGEIRRVIRNRKTFLYE